MNQPIANPAPDLPEPARGLTPQQGVSPSGLAYVVGSYLLWGFLPLYFLLLQPTGPVEVVAWRVVLSLVFCMLLLTVVRHGWRRCIAIVKNPRLLGALALAGVLVLINWTIFLFAVFSGHVIEGSLGYFINPLVSVLLGVVILREKLRPLQWVALGISAIAVLVLAFAYGSVPWIALGLACSFGLYGFVKKAVGPKVDAISGLAVETAAVSPLAIVALIVVASSTGLTLGTISIGHTIALGLVGVATAVPLMLFAAGARRLPLSVVGFSQYLAPILQFLSGVLLLHEPMPTARWIGFGIVWLALVILTIDMVIAMRRSRRGAAEPETGTSEIPLLT